MSRAPAGTRRRSGGQAKRPRRSGRGTLSRRLPSRGRVMALLLFAGLVGGLVTLLNGPWLRVAQVEHAGERYTPPAALLALLDDYLDWPLLALDSAVVEDRLMQLPAVAEARVRPLLPDRLSVEIVEKAAAATWLTPGARLVLATDGAVIAALPRGEELTPELAALPAVDDQRSESRWLDVGGAVPQAELDAARRLLGLDPELIGSAARGYAVHIHDEYGFILVSSRPAWRAAMGFYQAAPGETQEMAAARFEAQVTALRTLFVERREGTVTWVDARNPGKVYWAP
ncbi:MAG TPA: FtsQ-type POTRA domain-containing protein [Candidatus Limnocylindria bacterium]